jgi:hypothetical protein
VVLRGHVLSTSTGLGVPDALLRDTLNDRSAASGADGAFELRAPRSAAITVSAQGFVARVMAAPQGDSDELELFLQPIALEVTVDTTRGASVDVAPGVRLAIPAGVRMRNTRGAIVEGEITVQVASFHPANALEAKALPAGDALDAAGERVDLVIGSAIEVTALAAGEPVNIADGDRFEVELPASSPDAPVEAGMWTFDPARGVWQEETSAVRTIDRDGNPIYRAPLPHLSWWGWGDYVTGDDPNHCGSCDTVCPAAGMCRDGSCRAAPVCGDGFVDGHELS